jgi:hypothetical protein
MWRITKRIANSLEERKEIWTTALRKAITEEMDRAHSSSDWPDFRHVWNAANKAVGLRMSYEDLKRIVTWHFDENIVDKKHILEDLWGLTAVYAKKEKEHLHQTEWENLLKTEFTKEIGRAARHHTRRDYETATQRAFQKIGYDINPRWLEDFKITGDTLKDPYKLEDIWVTTHRYLQQEEEIKAKNRVGKEHWMHLLTEAINCDEQHAQSEGKSICNYSNAILYSLSQTGRRVNPDILKGIPRWCRKHLESKEILDHIWELACLELDYETLESKEQARAPQEITPHKRWESKLRELLYANWKNIRETDTSIHKSTLIFDAFKEIGWNFKKTKLPKVQYTRHPHPTTNTNPKRHLAPRQPIARTNEKAQNIFGISCGSS